MSQRLKNLENNSIAGDVQPYSKFIRLLRLLLPVGGLVVIVILFLWPQLAKIDTQPLTTQDINALKQTETENRLLNPTFSTLDSNGKPVTITADEASQNKATADKISLISPSAKIGNVGNVINFVAKHGVYNQTSKIISLRNNVIITDKDNNTLETNDIIADIDKGTAISKTPAKLTTKQAVITGQSVTLDQNNQTTTFQGPAKAVITP